MPDKDGGGGEEGGSRKLLIVMRGGIIKLFRNFHFAVHFLVPWAKRTPPYPYPLQSVLHVFIQRLPDQWCNNEQGGGREGKGEGRGERRRGRQKGGGEGEGGGR